MSLDDFKNKLECNEIEFEGQTLRLSVARGVAYKKSRKYKEVFQERELKKFKEIKEQCEYSRSQGQFETHSHIFEMAIKELYKNTHIIKEFVEANNMAIKKVLSK